LGIRGKRRVDFKNLNDLFLLHPELALNGRVIFGTPTSCSGWLFFH
jgi:hypothetical protein